MAIVPGPLTSDDVLPLQTIIDRMVFERNQADMNWRSVFCDPTIELYVRVKQHAMRMRPHGSDTATPDLQKSTHQTITLPTPKKYSAAAGVTQEALEQGVTRAEVMDDVNDLFAADTEFLIQSTTRGLLLDGGWWDTTATPPNWAQNTFAGTHEHYLAYNQAGVLTLANVVTMKRHIQEHGFGMGGGLLMLMNGSNVAEIEKLPELATAPGPMPTGVMDSLQANGIGPEFRLSGVNFAKTDWLPENYALMVDLSTKPMLWRNPAGTASDGALRDYSVQPDIRYAGVRQLTRYGDSAKVRYRSAGVAVYLGSGTWTDPTITLQTS